MTKLHQRVTIRPIAKEMLSTGLLEELPTTNTLMMLCGLPQEEMTNHAMYMPTPDPNLFQFMTTASISATCSTQSEELINKSISELSRITTANIQPKMPRLVTDTDCPGSNDLHDKGIYVGLP